MVTYFDRLKSVLFWVVLASLAFSVAGQEEKDDYFVSQEKLAYGFSMTALQGRNAVDPRRAITLKAVGLGSRLSNVVLLDDTGKILFKAENQTHVSLPTPLAFGLRYIIKVTTERAWTGQHETRELNFTTVAVPKLEGPTLTLLGSDASVSLHFDRPVSAIQATGGMTLRAEIDESGQNIRLHASNYEQNRKYVILLQYKTITGVPVPPLSLELTTPPPLVAVTNIHGLTNLGLMLPLQINFSEPLENRADASNNVLVSTLDGKALSGKWSWYGQRRLQFTPYPAWPASSIIAVKVDGKNLKSMRGGTLERTLTEQFSTGTDKRLFVYLDSQRVEAVENGKVIREFKVSTGKSKTPTVTGSFYIYDRYRHKTMRSDVERGQQGFYEVKDVPYTQFFHKDYAFHGAFWHNNFGNPASHGCVNMATKDQNKRWPNAAEDAGWLYNWGALGLPVTVMRKAPESLQASLNPAKARKGNISKVGKQPPKLADRQELHDNVNGQSSNPI